MPQAIKPLNQISSVVIDNLYLPNSVAVADGQLLVSEGGRNSVGVFDIGSGGKILETGRKGYGRQKFKEPVFFAANAHPFFYLLADWHNHRIVKLDGGLRYLDEAGSYHRDGTGRIRTFFARIKISFSSVGSYLPSHFIETEKKPGPTSLGSRLAALVTGFVYHYFIRRRRNVKPGVNKPNGIFCSEGRIYFSQKDNKCVSVLDVNDLSFIDTIHLPLAGRLGQLIVDGDFVLVCDETNSKIWKIDRRHYTTEGIDAPLEGCFALSRAGEFYFLVGRNKLAVLDESFSALEVFEAMAEFHGVAAVGGELYLCDRYHGQILRIKIHDLFTP